MLWKFDINNIHMYKIETYNQNSFKKVSLISGVKILE